MHIFVKCVGSIQLLYQWQCTDNYRKNVKCIPYSGKLSREKTFVSFVVLWLFVKVFSINFWGLASFGGGGAKARNPRKFSPWKLYFSPIHKHYRPRKLSAIYSTCTNFNILLAAPCLTVSFQKLFPTNKRLHAPSCQWFIDQPVCSWDPVSQADSFV